MLELFMVKNIEYPICFPEWRWQSSKYDPKYEEILRLFQDRKSSCYSIHQIGNYSQTCLSVREDKQLRSTFLGNSPVQCLKFSMKNMYLQLVWV